MVYPIGPDRVIDEATGQVVGTTPVDLQRWIWSLYRSSRAAIVRSAGRVSGTSRMAYQVLSMSDEDAQSLAQAIQDAHTRLHRCPVCQNFTEQEICPICAGAKRDKSVICVVEKPRDVQAFERTREYHGLYHVLHGLISPMDGVGAEQLSVKELLARLKDGTVQEVIMAMNPTVEGEATAMYLAKLIKPLGIRTTRLAYGLPVGSSLEYTDETTLYRALAGRDEL